MYKRQGGNFAKAAAEVAGLVNATGSDARGFCAAPTHALIEAAAPVSYTHLMVMCLLIFMEMDVFLVRL